MHKFAGQSQANKNVSIIEELSPDALFIRSTLRINGAEFSDFGTYTCTVVNSLNKPDMLHIKLNPSAPTGKQMIFLNSSRLFIQTFKSILFCISKMSNHIDPRLKVGPYSGSSYLQYV